MAYPNPFKTGFGRSDQTRSVSTRCFLLNAIRRITVWSYRSYRSSISTTKQSPANLHWKRRAFHSDESSFWWATARCLIFVLFGIVDICCSNAQKTLILILHLICLTKFVSYGIDVALGFIPSWSIRKVWVDIPKRGLYLSPLAVFGPWIRTESGFFKEFLKTSKSTQYGAQVFGVKIVAYQL